MMTRRFIWLVFIFVVIKFSDGGTTSSYIRNPQPSIDMPFESFPPPPGDNAPEQVFFFFLFNYFYIIYMMVVFCFVSFILLLFFELQNVHSGRSILKIFLNYI